MSKTTNGIFPKPYRYHLSQAKDDDQQKKHPKAEADSLMIVQVVVSVDAGVPGKVAVAVVTSLIEAAAVEALAFTSLLRNSTVNIGYSPFSYERMSVVLGLPA